MRLLSEEPPLSLGIIAKSSLVSECVERVFVRCRLHVFCNKSWNFFPFLALLDFSMVGWEIAWLILCIWREIRFIMSVLLSSFSFGKNAWFFLFFFKSWAPTLKKKCEDEEWWSLKYWSEEHRSFVEQQGEECFLVNAKSRWIRVMKYLVFHGISCHLFTCKLAFIS